MYTTRFQFKDSVTLLKAEMEEQSSERHFTFFVFQFFCVMCALYLSVLLCKVH